MIDLAASPHLDRWFEATVDAVSVDPDTDVGEWVELAAVAAERIPRFESASSIPLERPTLEPISRTEWVRRTLRDHRPVVFGMLHGFLDPEEGEGEGERDLEEHFVGATAEVASWLAIMPLVELSLNAIGPWDPTLPYPVGGTDALPIANSVALANRWGLDLPDVLGWVAARHAAMASLQRRADVAAAVARALDRYWTDFAFDLDAVRATVVFNPKATSLEDATVVPDYDDLAAALLGDQQEEALVELASINGLVEATSNWIATELAGGAPGGTDPVREAVSRHRLERADGLRWWLLYLYAAPFGAQARLQCEAFVGHVVAERGPAVLSDLWASASSVPTFDELYDPNAWLRRSNH